jgi:hypothetical protein
MARSQNLASALIFGVLREASLSTLIGLRTTSAFGMGLRVHLHVSVSGSLIIGGVLDINSSFSSNITLPATAR